MIYRPMSMVTVLPHSSVYRSEDDGGRPGQSGTTGAAIHAMLGKGRKESVRLGLTPGRRRCCPDPWLCAVGAEKPTRLPPKYIDLPRRSIRKRSSFRRLRAHSRSGPGSRMHHAPVVIKQLWDSALAHVHDLSRATLYRNAELEARVAELEGEVAAMKLAYNTTADIDNKRPQLMQRPSLTRQSPISMVADPMVLCAIDGDRLLFHPTLIEQGYSGGRQAAQDFTKAIAQELLQQGLTGFERLSFWVTVYLNKRALLNALREDSIATPEQFESFLLGFGQASPRFMVVDSGPGRDSTEIKVKEYVKTYIRFPQTLRLFFGGVDDTYLAMYDGLEKEDLVGKLVLMQPPNEMSPDTRRMAARSLRFDGLFMSEKVTPWMTRRPGPLLGISDSSSGVVTNGGLISPQSESQSSMSTPPPRNLSSEGRRAIDPTKPLHKQNPPPCNEHYLMACSKGMNCKYSHDWYLTPEQLEILARNAKKAPCNYLKNGISCPHGDACCWGHVCPSGARCFHLSKGKCWFKGDGMHPLVIGLQPVETA
ncbi:hypothetical protein BC628DRAFT_1347344 [Trametes gibbosa]|nr:hypothetical protein BC628DRAFT_1347344 [Trametes gibbosa]